MSVDNNTNKHHQIPQSQMSRIITNDDRSMYSEARSSLLEDILPSFQMHNYMFNRPLHDDLNSTDLPGYESELATLRSNRVINPSENIDIDPIRNPKSLLLNNTNNLIKVDLPIDIKITLTKQLPMIGKSFERESLLTEYKPGDLITGYVTIKSNINEPLPFEILLVSLEGEMRTPASGSTTEDRKIISKSFLKTYDLNACFHTGHILAKVHGIKGISQKDFNDNTVIGFTENRCIEPETIHKKFFSFKLPYSLLDTNCPDQIPEHLHMLPSYGYDASAIGDTEQDLEIDPILGYKRCDGVYGSPIIVDDFALKEQSISYFIKVEMIGYKDIAEKFGRKIPKSINNKYVMFDIEKFYFRVNLSSENEHFAENQIVDREIKTNIRTYEQIIKFEKLVSQYIDELKTKRQLQEGGILDRREQDEIVASLEVDETKKYKQLNGSSTNFHPEIIRSDGESFLHYDNIEMNKDFFGRSGGEIVIKASMSRDSSIKSIRSFALKSKQKKKHSKNEQNNDDKGRSNSLNPQKSRSNVLTSFISNTIENGRNKSVPISSIGSDSPDSLSTVTSLLSLRNVNQEHCFVEFEFSTEPCKAGNKNKAELPTSVNITSKLKTINVFSNYALPINFDGEFLMDEQLIQYTIPSIRRQFTAYLNELKRLIKETQVNRNIYNSVNAMSKLSVKELYVPKFKFLEETINLSNKWMYDEDRGKYVAKVKIPLAMSVKQRDKSSLCLIPTFESCLINRYYMVHFQVSIKKGKKYSVFKFPIKVT